MGDYIYIKHIVLSFWLIYYYLERLNISRTKTTSIHIACLCVGHFCLHLIGIVILDIVTWRCGAGMQVMNVQTVFFSFFNFYFRIREYVCGFRQLLCLTFYFCPVENIWPWVCATSITTLLLLLCSGQTLKRRSNILAIEKEQLGKSGHPEPGWMACSLLPQSWDTECLQRAWEMQG